MPESIQAFSHYLETTPALLFFITLASVILIASIISNLQSRMQQTIGRSTWPAPSAAAPIQHAGAPTQRAGAPTQRATERPEPHSWHPTP